ncbi:MAG: hypothetical protein KatS3mg022_0902 [Armatimonadota bacterium]|nr:MAG: hypothetical protein KatS3mg022_0902 [Armatimonadota bacterium]
MEPLSISQVALRLVLALAVVAWSWYTAPLQQLVTGIAGGVLLLAAVKPKSRLAAGLDVLAVSVLQAYSPEWLPLSAWVIAVHRQVARSVALLLVPAPFIYVWQFDRGFVWWAVLFGILWLYLGFALAEKPADEDDDGLLLPLPDDLREQWEQEREAHRQLRYQYQQMVAAYRELMAQRQMEHVRLQMLRIATLTKEPGEVARRLLSVLREYTGAKEGALWLYEEYDSSLRLAHATDSRNVPVSIAIPQPLRLQDEATALRAALEQFKSALCSSSGEGGTGFPATR